MESLEMDICFDLYHVEKKHHQVVNMISKIDKSMSVSVKITNNKEMWNDEVKEICDPGEQLIPFNTGNQMIIKKGFYEVITLTETDLLDIKDLLDSTNGFPTENELVIKCKLCDFTLTNQDEFKSHNESRNHYMKYAADLCQNRNDYKQLGINGWKKENLGRKIFDILYPIAHQISELDIGGKIVLQPGLAGQEAARECFEEILFDILMASTDTNEDSGFE